MRDDCFKFRNRCLYNFRGHLLNKYALDRRVRPPPGLGSWVVWFRAVCLFCSTVGVFACSAPKGKAACVPKVRPPLLLGSCVVWFRTLCVFCNILGVFAWTAPVRLTTKICFLDRTPPIRPFGMVQCNAHQNNISPRFDHSGKVQRSCPSQLASLGRTSLIQPLWEGPVQSSPQIGFPRHNRTVLAILEGSCAAVHQHKLP